jgi:hypothetical protein
LSPCCAGVYKDEARLIEEQEVSTQAVKDLLTDVADLIKDDEGDKKPHAMDTDDDEGPDAAPEAMAVVSDHASVGGVSVCEEDVGRNDQRYGDVLAALLRPILRRKRSGASVDCDAMAEEILAWWRKRRDVMGPLVRAYHRFSLMPNWGLQDGLGGLIKEPSQAEIDANRQVTWLPVP